MKIESIDEEEGISIDQSLSRPTIMNQLINRPLYHCRRLLFIISAAVESSFGCLSSQDLGSCLILVPVIWCLSSPRKSWSPQVVLYLTYTGL